MTRVLLIEDDFYIANLYVEVLTKNNFEVITAVNGEDGLDLINTQKFDLILLDLMLPDLSGEAILESIRNRNLKIAPVILLTNVAQDTLIEKCKKLGASGYIPTADILPHDLLITIQNFLSTGVFKIHKV